MLQEGEISVPNSVIGTDFIIGEDSIPTPWGDIHPEDPMYEYEIQCRWKIRRSNGDAEEFGGEESDINAYDRKRGRGDHYSDKGDHKERSIFHQPRHQNHWKKVED